MHVLKSIFTTLALMGLLAGCDSNSGTSNEPKDASNQKLKIVATVGMVADLARNIGGDHVTVDALMGAGVDPHLYKASAGDVRRLGTANVIFYSGLHLEAKMGDVLEQMHRRAKVVAVAEAANPNQLISPPEFQGQHDPHVWFDVSMWLKAAERVRDTLVEVDNAHASDYKANADRYLKEMADLHNYVKQQSNRIPPPQRVLVTAHDAFNYFGRAYNFEVRGLQGISTASEAGTRDVDELAKFIAERKIPAMFVESSVPKRNIEAVQEAVKSKGFQVKIGGQLYSDAMGDAGTTEGTYLGMVRHNIDVIVHALAPGTTP
ncbi:MAG: metal ABC transporter solute-binding protein, Zn/Mn family [Candidatus Sumerlaeaceae bacterium]